MRADIEYGVAPAGYRLPAETRLGAVRLQVAALARSLRFYTEVLGLSILEHGPGHATLGAAGGAALIELHELVGARPAPQRGRLGLYHFAILLPHRSALGRLLAHLDAGGIRFGSADHLVSEALYLSDPDGLWIEVYADRPREGWETHDRELVMASDPLDTADLIRAGGGEPWTGLPAGTAIGHVHLHVAGLDAASAFYHHGLGLDAMVWSYPGALFLAAGGYHHHLGLNTWAGPAAAPPAADDARLLEWTILVPGAEAAAAAAQSLRAAGAVLAGDDGSWSAADPWGTTVRVRSAVSHVSRRITT